jgi:endonuclease YncB( thermonuclease family)
LRRTLLALAVLLLACEGSAAPAAWTCTLTRVVDGDTLHARCDGDKVKVRLLRIDTPEREEPGYSAAGAALRRFLADAPLELEFERPGVPVSDDYGRLLAYVRVRGELANVEMVRLGWSPFWTKYGAGRFADAFRKAEREAREAHRGLWADGASQGSTAEHASGIAPLFGGAPSACRSREECCRVCSNGVACGDSCISEEGSCRQESGCACDREALCAPSAP